MSYSSFLIKIEDIVGKKQKQNPGSRMGLPILVTFLLLENNWNSRQIIYFLQKRRKLNLLAYQIGPFIWSFPIDVIT